MAALLVLGPALAAADARPGDTDGPHSRQVPSAAFSLGIEAALPAVRIAEAVPLVAALERDTERPAVGIAQLRLPDVRDLSTLRHHQAQTSSDQVAPRWGGFGRWLKRHWWVPVLGAAAVGYAVSESGGDDDRLGEDD